MFPRDYYELMAEYNAWMDGKIYEKCAAIPDADRRKDMGAFFKSIHGTLNTSTTATYPGSKGSGTVPTPRGG
jgi:uncharacterized damage-inducible protein DinB